MKSIMVLGAGLIGKAIAIDLCTKYEVSCADIQLCSLEVLSPRYPITTVPVDFKNTESLRMHIKPYDLIISAVPGFMGFDILKTIIEEGKNVVDISFFPENAFELDALAKEHNVTAIVDCGVAPGMCNIIAGYLNKQMKIDSYECLVGGLPVKREWPFEYKAVFSPADVIEEYNRPARFVKNGKAVIAEALSDIGKVNLEGCDELESFNTDGLRSLAITMPHIPNMIEKTLRYPGHAALMKIFRETGLFSKVEININGTKIAPLEFTSKLLFPKWKMKEGDEDFTVMRVNIEGDDKKITYTLLDYFDKENNTSSMARTTGYTCTAVVNLVLDGNFTRKGICPPEFIGEDKKCFDFVLEYLNKRKVNYKREIVENKKLINI